ncbi:MAG TPA: RcnB family protein [Sphingobium sp.]
MVKGWRAGLLALTALATTVPAVAQRGDGNWRGGGERQGNPGGGGGENRGGWNGGNAGGNGGAQPAPQQQQQQPARDWRNNDGGGNRGWQGQPQAPRPDNRPDMRPDQRPDNPGRQPAPFPNQGNGRAWAAPGQPNGNWNRNDPGRSDSNRWNNDRGGGVDDRRPDQGRPSATRPDFGRPEFGRPGFDRPEAGRPNVGRPNYARPGNGWQNGGRLSNNDRWRDQQRWSNNWRRDSRYDWSSYRQYNRNAYRLPAYRPPVGWGYGYSRFSIGVFLGSPLFSNSYWLDDPYSYRLPPAYGTLRWIRYYDDALLVDIRDGYVADVIHDFFW